MVRIENRMLHELGTGTGRSRWDHAALLALALQVRSAWLLLGVWVAAPGARDHPLFRRIRMLPAHPDWVLPALVQSVVAALLVVGLARRWRAGWVLLAATVASGVAWGVTFAWVPSGLDGYLLLFQPVHEILAMAIVLVSVALAWRQDWGWTAVLVIALAGGVGAAAIRLVLTYTVFGVGWPDEWPRVLAGEVVATALLALVIMVLRGRAALAQAGLGGEQGWRSGAALGTLGLLGLTVAHLVAGGVYSAWTVADSSRLLVAAGLLAVLAGRTLVTSRRMPYRRPG